MSGPVYTPAPWQWVKWGGEQWMLISERPPRLVVMDFVRHGMQGAQPRFSTRGDNMGGVMQSAEACNPREQVDARLIESAPDHALLAAALVSGAIRWESASGDCGAIACRGIRYYTQLDEFGVPVIDGALRDAITAAMKAAMGGAS